MRADAEPRSRMVISADFPLHPSSFEAHNLHSLWQSPAAAAVLRCSANLPELQAAGPGQNSALEALRARADL